MTALSLIFTLAAIGISETSYLIGERLQNRKPVCIIGTDCVTVLESRYNRMFFVPNEVLGLIFYFSFALFASFLVIGFGPLDLWQRIVEVLAILGTLFSLFFLFLQWKIIKAWCFWCVMSAFTVFLITLIVFTASLT